MYVPKHVDLRKRRTAWHGHIPFAYDLVKGLKPRTIVELGTHYGGSYFTFCDSVKINNLSTECYAIDTWVGEEHAGFYDNSVFEFVNQYNSSYESFSSLIRSNFDASAPLFPDNSIDLVHIDGFHSYEAVLNDYKTWKPKLSAEGIMLFHDVCAIKPGFGVHEFWAELQEQYKSQCFHFEHSYGLGVLSLSREEDVLERLAKILAKDASKIKSFYETQAKWLKFVLKVKKILG